MALDKNKQKVIQLAFMLAAFMLLSKAAQIQLFDSSYKNQAIETTLDKKLVYPSRGLIYDRNGKLLVINNPIYDLKVTYNKVDPDMDTTKFCRLLEIDKETFIKNMEKDWRSPMYNKRTPFNFLNKISPEQFAKFQEHLFEFPGFFPVMRNIRGYPHQNAPHVLGYIGEVNRTDIDESEGVYSLGDYIGINGLEKQYEDQLRGAKGISYVLKDNLGREVENLDQGKLDSAAVSGRNIISTIDLDLQAYGEQLMQGKKGSIVAIEPKTGEILTMVSSPSFDPNLLSVNKYRGAAFKTLLEDTISRPMLDRSIMAKYPPGSIFKPILALIALQEGVTYPNRTIYCDMGYEYKGTFYGCHEHITPWNMKLAIQHSCNAYFMQLCRDVLEMHGFNNPAAGLQVMRNHLHDFGLGRRLGIDNMHENKGFVPDNDFYNKLYDKTIAPNGWRSTYIMSIGIGQGELELTTLQMANLAAIIANRGYHYTPHLLKYYEDNGERLEGKYAIKHTTKIDSNYYDIVVDGMERVIQAGTATSAYIPGISVCGKTGTSQNPHGKDHSVFFAFAPKDDPQIAIAVFVENAGFGGDYAAPIASLIIEKHINGEIAKNRKWIEERMTQLALIVKP